MFSGMATTEATIRRFTATGTDSHGQATGTWADLAPVFCEFQEWSAEEAIEGVLTVVRHSKAWFDAEVDLTEADRLVIGGATYEVKGVVAWAGDHLEVALKRCGT